MAYQDYKRLFAGARWEKLAAKGAKPQRLLWASTGTKNKDYSDVLYVEELIGPNTVNTVPPATLDAFRDHGKLRNSLEENIDDAQRACSMSSQKSGISLDQITADLVKDGVKLFADAADKLYGAVAHKRAIVLGAGIDSPEARARRRHREGGREAHRGMAGLGENPPAVEQGQVGLDRRRREQMAGLAHQSPRDADIADYEDFAERVKGQKFTDAVVLGMGGSSLGPEVLAQTFPRKSGFPRLHVLDSTDPAQVRALEKAVDIGKTLFIVSSKSGGTTEPNVMKDYFYDRVAKAIGKDKAGHRFIAVTDAGSSLEKVATKQGFARVFHGEPTIGGRYSVLSPFGLVPAAAAGIDVRSLIENALHMVRSCGADVPPHENPGVQLGLAMGLAGLEGRDKVTILSSNKIADFGAWAEQLIAESTGKDGKGLIPIDGEPLGDVSLYGNDRFFIDIRVQGDEDAAHDEKLAALRTGRSSRGAHRDEIDRPHRTGVLPLGDGDRGRRRNPRHQSVQPAGRRIVQGQDAGVDAGLREDRQAAGREAGVVDGWRPISTPTRPISPTCARPAPTAPSNSWLKAHLSRIDANDYVALLAYIEREPDHIDLLQDMRLKVGERRRVATCAEFGPRFLHSTGQAYKGGPDSGVFLQITADDARDLPVPGQKASFGVIKAAAARGDFDVLIERGRRALRVHLKGDLASGLKMLDAAITDALS